MTKRISGINFDTTLMGAMVHVEKATCSITDNTAAAQTRGIPDGHVDGDVAAELDFELDTKNFNVLIAAAKTAGSFRGMEPDDVLFYANSGSEQFKVEAFGVKLLASDLIDMDPKGGSKSVHKVKGLVTSPDFIHLNGVPYLSADDTRHLIG
ncbi:phage protein [Aeromonas hydrophila]|uniref:phage protein n=1 Tax=Aeromonas hydrophila TaxID=644 RepID=UPI003D1C40A2